MRWSLLVAAMVIFAGCLVAPPDDQATPTHSSVPADLSQIMAGVPCDAPYSASSTTKNLKRLNLTTFDGPGGPQELDVRDGLLLAARAGGFSPVDVRDPANPVVLGHYGDAGGMLDVKFSPDNQTALVSSVKGIDLVDVVLYDGVLYAGAYTGGHEIGLHVIGYGCITPGEPRFTSTG